MQDWSSMPMWECGEGHVESQKGPFPHVPTEPRHTVGALMTRVTHISQACNEKSA